MHRQNSSQSRTINATPMQRGMVFHARLHPGGGTDIEQVVLTFDEPVDEARLRGAWEETLSRYPVFRTGFSTDGPIRQIVAESAPFQWAWVEDMSLESFLKSDRRAGFDLGQPPLSRCTLLGGNVLVWTVHHALLDGRALARVLREVFAHYEGRVIEPGEAATFAEFVEVLPTSLDRDFWGKHLAGFRACTPLGVEGLGSAEGPQRDRERLLSEADTAELARFSARAGVSLNILLQAAWALLLQRYSREDDVVFGATRAGRKGVPVEARDTVGLCINTVPVRVITRESTTVSELLQALRQQWTDLRPYEHAPLAEVQKCGELPAGQPLFRSLAVYDHQTLSAAVGRSVRLYEQTGLPLALAAYGGERLTLRLQFDPALFDDAIIDRMLGHVATLLRELTVSGDRPVRTLRLEAAELEEWPLAPIAADYFTTIHEVFERQAAENPDAIALIDGDRQLTYRELNARSNAIAHRLKIAPESLVAVFVERSAEQVIALLAVLKAGGAYVPIDPDYPAERIGYILGDSRAAVVLTSRMLRGKLPTTEARVLVLEDGAAERENLSLPASDSAYVIYTSGSTGQPKGTLVTHANVLRLFDQTDDWFHFEQEDVWTLFHSCAFDFSVWEIWGALLHGGRLVTVPYLTSRSPDAFLELLRREKVTVLNQTPSAFYQLVAADRVEPTDLRMIIFGGEALDPAKLEPWFDRHGEETPRLINMYGITETTVHVTYRPVQRGMRRSLIGEPIPDLELLILDANLRPCPIGVPGEMLVGGGGVARGYLHRPELTAERFIPHPRDTTRRLYRTGDLARRLPDGDIEYLGRIDAQLKVRGFRIEPGEIEAALCDLDGITQALVVPRPDASGSQQLVAYLCAQTLRDDLRERLSRKLPGYMIPAAFVRLDRLPLTAHGKVDLAALPTPQPVAAGGGEAPSSMMEQKIADIWREVLGLEAVAVDDNFFDLGGHSLLVLQVHQQLANDAFTRLKVVDLFEYPTVRSLGQFLSGQTGGGSDVRQRARQQQAALARRRGASVRTPGPNAPHPADIPRTPEACATGDLPRVDTPRMQEASPVAHAFGVQGDAPPPAFPFQPFSDRAETQVTQRRLPHWRQDGVTYFVTFRLAGSLPSWKLAELRQAAPSAADQIYAQSIERYLDTGQGSCLLADPANARIVADALTHFDGDRYLLGPWCVMPNHVHVIVTPLGEYQLSAILHSWKTFTANRLHVVNGSSGPVWQRESYDHIIRDERALAEIGSYIEGNPAEAGVEALRSCFMDQRPEGDLPRTPEACATGEACATNLL